MYTLVETTNCPLKPIPPFEHTTGLHFPASLALRCALVLESLQENVSRSGKAPCEVLLALLLFGRR